MPRQFQLADHLTIEEIGLQVRFATDPVARTHWRIILLAFHQIPITEIAWRVGRSSRWVSAVLHRYNADGPDSLGDLRQRNRGAEPLLDAAGLALLRQALAGPAPDGGPWTARHVADWMSARLGRPISTQVGWSYRRRAEATAFDAASPLDDDELTRP